MKKLVVLLLLSGMLFSFSLRKKDVVIVMHENIHENYVAEKGSVTVVIVGDWEIIPDRFKFAENIFRGIATNRYTGDKIAYVMEGDKPSMKEYVYPKEKITSKSDIRKSFKKALQSEASVKKLKKMPLVFEKDLKPRNGFTKAKSPIRCYEKVNKKISFKSTTDR